MARVLALHVLKLLAGVAQNDHCRCDLLAKLVKLFIAFFDLLVKGLVLDLQLLEIDQVEPIG